MTANRPTDARSFRFLPTRDMLAERSDEEDPLRLLRHAGSAVWRYRYALAAWIALCVIVAAVVARSTPRSFTAAATILLDPRRPAPVGREIPAPAILDLNRADTEIQVIRSERLLRQVFEGLNLAASEDLAPAPAMMPLRFWPASAATRAAEPPDSAARRASAFADFTRRVSVRRIGQSYVVEVAYSARDAATAARVANAVAAAYLLQSVTHKLESARAGSEWVQARADNLAAQVAAGATALREGRPPAGPMPDADGRMIGEALVPLAPSAPRPTLIVALGAAVGGATALCFVILIGLLDRRLHTAEAVTSLTGLPCLATIPRVRPRRWAGPLLKRQKHNLVADDPGGEFARAIANLRAGIKLASPTGMSRPGEILALASWTQGTGCSFLAMNLARLAQCMGRRVTVIETDVEDARRSVVQPASAGLGSLVGFLSYRIPDADLRLEDLSGIARLPAWLPEDGAAIVDFDGASMGRLLDDRRSRGDVVLDLAPLGEMAVAAALARRADAVIIVAAASRSTVDDVQAAARMLAAAGANVVGVVLNRAP